MKLSNLNKREELLLYIIILIITGILFYRFMISPGLMRVRDSAALLHQQQDAQRARIDELRRRNTLDNKIKQLKAKTAGMEILLFYKHEIPDFLKFLSDLITQTGNIVITIRPDEIMNSPQGNVTDQKEQNQNKETQTAVTADKPSYLLMPVEVSIKGSYDNVKRFFDQLKSYRKLLTLSDFNIITGGDNYEIVSKFVLNMYIYENETQK